MARRVKKETPPPPPRALNRKELSRAERDALQRRRLLTAAGALLALALVVLVAGIVQSQVLTPRQPVARINGETVTTRDYQQRVNFNRWQLRNAIVNLNNQLDQLPSDDPSVDFIRQIYQQQSQQLQQQYASVGSLALEEVIEGALIRQKAAELGITVSDDEVNAEIERQVARGLGAIRPSDATATATAAAEATATAAGFTPTPTLEPTATLNPEAAAAITQTATPFPPTSTPEPTPTPNYLTTDAFTEQFKETLADLQETTGLTEAQYREIVRTNLLRQKLQEHFAEQVTPDEEQVEVQQIVFESQEAALAAREQLVGGADFEEVARVQAAKTAGDLGFFTRDQMVEEFATAAFALEVGQISEPVKSQFGWHIIEVLEKDEAGERVRARHILVDTEEEAQEIKAELEDGADFGTLALERSRDAQPPQTELGWLTKESAAADPAVVEQAFTLKAGDLSEPIQIAGDRYALIEVTAGPEVRPLDEGTLEQKKQQAFRDWLNGAKASEGVERLWDVSKVPSDPFVRAGL